MGCMPTSGKGANEWTGCFNMVHHYRYKMKSIVHVEMFTLTRDGDRDQGPLFPIVPVLFPVGCTSPSPVPVQCE